MCRVVWGIGERYFCIPKEGGTPAAEAYRRAKGNEMGSQSWLNPGVN